MTTKEEDFVEKMVAVDSHSLLMFFTNLGKVQAIKAYRLPEAGRTAKGTSIVNILELREGEKVSAMLSVPQSDTEGYLFFVTRKGVVKRTAMSEFERHRKSGKNAINLDEGDELVFVCRTFGESEIIIATRNGMAVRFDENNVRSMGRGARGVKGITLVDDDVVVGVAVVDETKSILTVTENGMGKRTSFSDFREMKHRGGKGVTCHHISDKTGKLASIITVSEDDDIMLITNEGTIIRTNVQGINVYSRTASGVILMRLDDGCTINNVARLEKSEEIEKQSEEAEKEIENANATVNEPVKAEEILDSEE
jgi:DNA gyrase subunit A